VYQVIGLIPPHNLREVRKPLLVGYTSVTCRLRCRCHNPRFVLLLLLRLLLLLLLLPLLLLPGRQPTYRARGAVTNSVLKSGGPSRLQRLYLSSQHHVVAPGDIPLGGPLRQHGVQ
jgi:hypothetical protein